MSVCASIILLFDVSNCQWNINIAEEQRPFCVPSSESSFPQRQGLGRIKINHYHKHLVFGTQERTHDELFKELPAPPPPTNVFLEFIDFGCSAIVGVLRQKKDLSSWQWLYEWLLCSNEMWVHIINLNNSDILVEFIS